jgi:redox-sensitive bicupin YhaK (pirin superfamily)
MHSEYNPSKTEQAKLFQTWIFPKQRDIEPRYDQKSFTDATKHNELTTVVSGDKDAGTLYINQDAAISFGDFDGGKQVTYEIKVPGNGAYVLQVEGEADVDGSVLNQRDAIGVYDTSSFTIETKSPSRLLIIEIPMR